MRDVLFGLVVMIFVAGFGIYLYAPHIYHAWINRLLLAH